MALPRGLRRVLADTKVVMEKKEKKELNIKTMQNDFATVETIKTILMGPSILMCVVVIYKTVYFARYQQRKNQKHSIRRLNKHKSTFPLGSAFGLVWMPANLNKIQILRLNSKKNLLLHANCSNHFVQQKNNKIKQKYEKNFLRHFHIMCKIVVSKEVC